MSFRWEDIDHSLAGLRLLELSIEMNRLIRSDERRIRFEQRGNQNGNTVPTLVLQMQQDRANELAQKTYDIYCDVWQKQGNEKSPAFLRAVFARGVSTALRARARAIATEFADFARRTSFPPAVTEAHLRGLDLNMRRMEEHWRRRIEIEAKECEHAARIAESSVGTLTRGQPTSQKDNSSLSVGESTQQPRVESGQSVPTVTPPNRVGPVPPIEVPVSTEAPAPPESSSGAQTRVRIQAALPIPTPQYSGATDWQAVEIIFLSDFRVQIQINGQLREPAHYAELGFVDGRSENPNRAWEVFRFLAENNGILKDGNTIGAPWRKVEKRVQEIRKVLRELFGISADPLPFVAGTGYQAVFKIRCGSHFHQ